jgi:FkbM family methyltransferase
MNLKAAAKVIIPRAITNRIRIARYQWELLRFHPYQVRRSRAGFEFNLWISGPTARNWYDRDSPAVAPEIAFLAQHRLRESATVFECGAFQCLIAMVLAKFVGPAGKVVAVEAGLRNVEAGLRNCRLNDARNVEVIHAAVSSSSDQLVFSRQANGQVDDGSGAWGRTTVPSVSIDALTERFGVPDVLFIDVEGFEAQALQGATNTLARHRPDCFIEVHAACGLEKFGGSVAAVCDFLRTFGYILWMCGPGGESFIPLDERSALTKSRFFLIATASGS